MLGIKKEQFNRIKGSSPKAEYTIDGRNFITETAVLEYYKKNGFQGLWTENDYWLMLLSLLFWDVIFAKVDGAVSISVEGNSKSIHTYENSFDKQFDLFLKLNGMPSDMFDASFFEHRQDLIRARYKQLQNSNLSEELEKAYGRYARVNCRLINNWEKFSLADLKEPLKHLDKNTILRILLRILVYPAENRSGLPDLLIFNSEEIRFVEVKSENDKLSDKQIGWIAFLSLDIDQDVELFLINHTDKKIQNIEKQFTIFIDKILIQFGKASSKQYDKILSLFRGKSGYVFRDGLHGAYFSIYDKELADIVRTVGRWGSVKFSINGEIYSVEQIRHLIYEIDKNKEFDIDNFYSYPNPNSDWFNCNLIGLQYFNWSKFGYLDAETGRWIFDREKITRQVEDKLEDAKLCPYLNRKVVKDLFFRLPDSIDLKNEKQWVFLTSDNERWLYHKGEWVSFSSSLKNQSDIKNIIGVERISNEQREWILESTIRSFETDDYWSNIPIATPKPKGESKGLIDSVWKFLIPTKRDGCLGVILKLFLILLVLGVLTSIIPTLLGFGIAKLVDSNIHFKNETTRSIVKYSIIGVSIIINAVIVL